MRFAESGVPDYPFGGILSPKNEMRSRIILYSLKVELMFLLYFSVNGFYFVCKTGYSGGIFPHFGDF